MIVIPHSRWGNCDPAFHTCEKWKKWKSKQWEKSFFLAVYQIQCSKNYITHSSLPSLISKCRYTSFHTMASSNWCKNSPQIGLKNDVALHGHIFSAIITHNHAYRLVGYEPVKHHEAAREKYSDFSSATPLAHCRSLRFLCKFESATVSFFAVCYRRFFHFTDCRPTLLHGAQFFHDFTASHTFPFTLINYPIFLI